MKSSDMKVSTEQGTLRKNIFSRGTIDLIRNRCERDVRSGVLRWTGLPIGGTGALAFLATLLVWIPQQIQNTELGEVGQEILRDYMKTVLIDHPAYQEILDTVISSSVKDNADQEVANQIQEVSGAKVEQVLQDLIQNAIAEDIAQVLHAPAVETQVNAAVATVLQQDNYRPVRESIVASVRARLSESVAENAGQAVQAVANPLPPDHIIDKSTYSQLEQVLGGLESRPLPEGDFALRKYVAADTSQDHTYDTYLVGEYLSRLREAIGDQFRYVLILDRQSRFVALSTVDRFMGIVREDGNRLEGILNDGSLSLAQAKLELKELLGPDSLRAVDETTTIKAAIHSEDLRSRSRQVAVVEDSEGARIFKGVTNRSRLIEALLP